MLKQRLQQDQIAALKSGDQLKLNLLRYILAKIINKEIEKHSDLTDDEIISILRHTSKELSETLASAEKGGRQEIIAQTKKEIAYLSAYLPQQLSDTQLQQEIKKIITSNQSLFQKNPKAIIGICVKSLRAKADSQRIVALVSSLIQSNQ